MAEELEQIATPVQRDAAQLAAAPPLAAETGSSNTSHALSATRSCSSSSSMSTQSPDPLFLDPKGKRRLSDSHSADVVASPPTSYSGSSFLGTSTSDKGKGRADNAVPAPRPALLASPASAQQRPNTSSGDSGASSLPPPIALQPSRSRSSSMPLVPTNLRSPRPAPARSGRGSQFLSFSRTSSPLASGASTPLSMSRQSLVDPAVVTTSGNEPRDGRFSRSMSNIGQAFMARPRRLSSSAQLSEGDLSQTSKHKTWKKTKNRISNIVSGSRSRRNSVASPPYSPALTPGDQSPADGGSRNSSVLHLAMDARRPRPSSRARAVSTPVVASSPLVSIDPLETAQDSQSRPGSSLSRPPRSKFPLDLFDFLLPRELRVRILGMLIESCIDDWNKDVELGLWRGEASKSRYVGELRGRRELIRCGRVSRTWLSLSLDGQLWSHYPGSVFGTDILSTPHLLRIFNASGSFIKSLDIPGMRSLNGPSLATMVDLVIADRPALSLASLNLTGCTGLSSASIAYMLQYCPHLDDVCLRGLESVDSRVIEALVSTATDLRHLDVGRCSRLPVRLLRDLPSSLRTLKCAAMRGLTDEILVEVACALTRLETLDISSCHHVTDDAFLSIVQQTCNVPNVELGHSQRRVNGRETDLAVKRRLTWRHLNISDCRRLTDRAVSRLAYAVPNLEVLEMARIGATVQPVGVLHFLTSVPKIRCVDLEDASALTDAILLALTPTADPLSPGSKLEHLIINGCVNMTDSSIKTFIESSPLTRLEADSTTITEGTAKTFVQGVRARKEQGALLSLLDGLIGRRLAKSLALATRPRTGWRGYDSRHFDYHDEPVPRTLQECNDQLVTLRSFHGHMLLDLANETRQEKREQADRTTRGGANKRRAQALRDFTSGRTDDETSAFCILS